MSVYKARVTHGRRDFHEGARVEVLYCGEWLPGLITDVRVRASSYYDDVTVVLDDNRRVICSNDGLVLREIDNG